VFLNKNKKRNQKTIAFGHCGVCSKNFIDIESHKKTHLNEAKTIQVIFNDFILDDFEIKQIINIVL
jgi:hypothetical protein